jgi:hypothetical protein
MQRGAGKQLLCIRRRGCRGDFRTHATHAAGSGPARHGYVGHQTRLSGCKRGCRPRERSVAGFIGSSEPTEPIAPDQNARRNGNSHRTLIAPAIGATVIADVFFQQIGLVIANAVQFSTHCDPI